MSGSATATACRSCGCGPRLPSLFVCWACYAVRCEAAHREIERELRDPSQPLPRCSKCDRAETPQERIREEGSVSLALVEGDNAWTCMECVMDEGDPSEGWKS